MSGKSELCLDLTKDEKEAMLSKKMEEIRKKNVALQKRHEEIEADKKRASNMPYKLSSDNSTKYEAPPSHGPKNAQQNRIQRNYSPPHSPIKPRGRGKPKNLPPRPRVGFNAHMDHVSDEDDFVVTLDLAKAPRQTSPEKNGEDWSENPDSIDNLTENEPYKESDVPPVAFYKHFEHDDRDMPTKSQNNMQQNDNRNKKSPNYANRRGRFGSGSSDNSVSDRNRSSQGRGDSYEGEAWPTEGDEPNYDNINTSRRNFNNTQGESQPTEDMGIQNKRTPPRQQTNDRYGGGNSRPYNSRPTRQTDQNYEGERWPSVNRSPTKNSTSSQRTNNSYEGDPWPDENTTPQNNNVGNISRRQITDRYGGAGENRRQQNRNTKPQTNNSYEGEPWPDQNTTPQNNNVGNISRRQINDRYERASENRQQQSRNTNPKTNNSYEGEPWPEEHATPQNSISGNTSRQQSSNSYEGEPWPSENVRLQNRNTRPPRFNV